MQQSRIRPHVQKKREREIGAGGRYFELDVRNRFLMLLVYYRLYITYALSSFLFYLDQNIVCRYIQKIEGLIRQCVPVPQKIYKITKRLKTPEEVEEYFPGFIAFIDCTEQQIQSRPEDKRRRKIYYSSGKKKNILRSRISL
jgi:hypothetical protein